MRSAPTKSAPLGNSSWPASVGVNARTDTAKDGIRNALPNRAAPATKLTMKAKEKSSRPEQGEIEQALALGHHLLAEKRQQGGCADHGQPDDARFLEPVAIGCPG